jgi:Ran GTPase-activating protein (RanGAP) involved in mRNA processing and transport
MSPPGELSIKVITFIISYILDNPNTEFRILLILAKTCKQLQYSISNVSSLDLSKLSYSFRHLLQLRHSMLSGVNHAVNYARREIQLINESRMILSITHNILSLNLSHSVDPFRLLNYSFRNLSLLRHLDLSSIICTKQEISHFQRALIISSFTHLESFKYDDNDPRLLRLCLRNLPNLKALYLSHVDIGKYGNILSRAIGKLIGLTTLDISGTMGSARQIDRDMHNYGMREILRALPISIKTLNFHGNSIYYTLVRFYGNGKIIHKPIKNDELRAVADGLSRLTNLTTLDLSWTCINTKFMRILEPALCGLTQLKILHLDSIHDSYSEGEGELFILLASVIKAMTQLEILTLESNYINTSMTELCSAFRNLDKLKKLELKNTRSNSVGFSSIISVLPYMTSLTDLGLESTGCNDMHIPLLWDALSNHTTLTRLHLSNNNISDEYNTKPHFKCLTPIPKLLHLNLSFNNLNKYDMERILTAQTELKTLDFQRNVIDMEGLTLLIPSFEAMTQLRQLKISSSSYRNQLNVDVLSHLTLLRINENI